MKRRKWSIVSMVILIGTLLGCGSGNSGGIYWSGSATPPTVLHTTPPNGTTGYAVNKSITVTFSTLMNKATLTPSTFYLSGPSSAVTGSIILSGSNAVFTPAYHLAPHASYTATITTGVTNSAGISLASNYTWSFTTGNAIYTTQPTVISTTPANNSTNIAANSTIVANFSEVMDPATLTASTFLVSGPSGSINGTVTSNGVTSTFTPTGNFSIGATYTACLTSAATDLAGNPLASDYCWSFSTVGGGLSWTVQSSATSANLNGVVYNGAKYVAVGNGGAIVTSPNGTAWTMAAFSPTTDDLWDVTWTGTQFIAVGGMQNVSTTILTSSDGNIWAAPTGTVPPLSQPLYAVASAASNSQVAVGRVGQIAVVSQDGGNIWSQVTITTSASWDLDDIIWTGSQFVAVGVSGTVKTSPDGLTWTDHSTGTINILKSIAYSGAKYVAVGNGDVSTSTDAATWTIQNNIIPGDLRSVVWTGSRFVAVGVYTAGTNVGYITTSPNGITWNAVTVPTLDWLNKVAPGPSGTFVAVGRNGQIVTSP